MSTVEPMRPELTERATTTLGRAFVSDPVFIWTFPDPQERARSLPILNRVPLIFAMRSGHVMQADGGKAVAIWLPPGREVTMRGMIRSGLLDVPFRIGLRPFLRFMGALDIMGKMHAQQVTIPHWYLMVVAVDPELQGRGVGSSLIKEGLARADQASVPCYLETSMERNVPLYERHGFRVMTTVPLGKDGPPGWGMLREPQSLRGTASGSGASGGAGHRTVLGQDSPNPSSE